MLQIDIPEIELFDSEKQEFTYIKAQRLQLEHSLLSLSKWESKWCKPFLSTEQKTTEQTIDYIRCMTIGQPPSQDVYNLIAYNEDTIKQIKSYIDAPMTATWFNEKEGKKKASKEIVTAELIYYWMVALQIPFECEKWHLNKLLTLIKVCNIKNTPSKKMSKKDIYSRNKALNEARRMKYGTKG